MTPALREAIWWTVAFVAIAVTIAAGIRIVAWLMGGESSNVWRAALLLVGASGAGGIAVTAIRKNGK